jgi:hypothetical protein
VPEEHRTRRSGRLRSTARGGADGETFSPTGATETNFIARDGGAKGRREGSPERSGRTLTERSHPEVVASE